MCIFPNRHICFVVFSSFGDSLSKYVHLQGGGANDSVGAPIIRLQKTSGGAVDDGQTIGGISWFVNDSGVQSGASYERAKIIAESQNTSSGARLEFWTGNSNADIAERFRIQADGRLVQTHQGTTTGAVNLLGESGSSSKAITFAHVGNGAEVGTIVTGASSTTYNTSSDYRLKENVDYTWDATTRLKQLKPARFNFIIDDTNTPVDGFLAHEVSSIVPEAVSGVKDRVEVWENGEELPDGVSVGDNKLDKDGNTIPNYQGIDQSKLVPLLVKTIQELEARIKTLEDA